MAIMRACGPALFVALLSLLLVGCREQEVARWYRGNTHAHTVICGHADSPPEDVAAWYHDHGYNFLILSEHNHFIDPETVELPANRREDFILIPGEEITGPRVIHTTAMNVERLVVPRMDLEVKSEIIQDHVDGARAAGGEPILNHPNYLYAAAEEDILPVEKLYMFELFNGHPLVNNFGDGEHPSTEALWDQLLTAGMTVYGVSSDDAHYFRVHDVETSNPGRGWVMVRASRLSADAITTAMNRGEFYASSGVMLEKCSVSEGRYQVEVDRDGTRQELASPSLRGRRVGAAEQGFLIELFGPGGEVLSATSSTAASFALDDANPYVRPRVTFRRRHPEGGGEEFYAWGQPAFMDGRAGGG